MKNNTTNSRISAAIMRNLSVIVNGIINDEVIGFITITDVRTTTDYSISTVFFTIYKNDERTINYALKVIEQNKARIRSELAGTISYIRRIPNLLFKYDKSMAYANRIEEVLKEIKEKEKKD